MTTALLLIAHGSRQDEANADLRHMVEEVRRRGDFPIVEAAYLELAEPKIDQAAATCVERGAGRVILLPYFLSAGVHVQRDLAGLRQLLSERFPSVEFTLAKPLGRHPLLVDVVMDRAKDLGQETARSKAPPARD
jgi:sirohydrochlorin ferrochelatase